MANNEFKTAREQRLAAKLRENLRRRKVQAKAMAPAQDRNTVDSSGDCVAPALPKSGSKS